MLVKTLALIAVVVAATTTTTTTTSQAYDSNTCSACVFASVSKDTVCAALPQASQNQLISAFGPTDINIPLLASLVQNPAIKACLCHWTNTAFTSNGAAASCSSGAIPVCNSTEVLELQATVAPMAPVLNCGSTASSTTGPSGPTITIPNTTANPNTEKNSGAVIGGVVGGLVIVAVIASYLIYQRRKSKMAVNNMQSQKLEAHQQDDSHPSQKTQVLHPQNPSLPPMSQAPVFQQAVVFSTHPKPNVSTYMSNSQQQQQQQTVPSVWEPQPFVAPTAAYDNREAPIVGGSQSWTR